MKPEDYILSGILELYVCGALKNEECLEVQLMAKQHPEIQIEIDKIEQSLKKLAESGQTLHEHTFENIIDQVNESEHIADNNKIIPLHPFHDQQRRRYISLMVAAVALFLLASVSNVYFFNHWKNSEKSLIALKVEDNKTHKAYLETQQKLNSMQDELASYKSKDLMVVMLHPMKKNMDYKAIALYNPKMKSIQLKVMNLPTAPQGMQYQLWAIKDGKATDAGMITEINKMETMKSIPNSDSFAITMEKAGGSSEPTMASMLLMGKIEI